jgi:hypothetical protein
MFPCFLQAMTCDQCTPQPSPILVKNIIVGKMSYLVFACLELDFFFCFLTSNPEFYVYISIVIQYDANIQNIWFSLCLNYHLSAFSRIFCAYRNMKDLFLLNRSGFLQDTSIYCSHQVSWELTQGVADKNVWWLPRWRHTCTSLVLLSLCKWDTAPTIIHLSALSKRTRVAMLCVRYATHCWLAFHGKRHGASTQENWCRQYIAMWSEIFMAVQIKRVVFRDITQSTFMAGYQHFGRNLLPPFSGKQKQQLFENHLWNYTALHPEDHNLTLLQFKILNMS